MSASIIGEGQSGGGLRGWIHFGISFFMVFLCLNFSALAQSKAGGGSSSGTRGGGDSLEAERRSLRAYIEGDLANEAIAFIEGLHLGPDSRAEQSPDPRATLRSWVAEKLVDDLRHLKFDLRGACLAGSDRNWSASTELRRGAPICFDTYKLTAESVSRRRLIALLFHELAHQFGKSEEECQALETWVSRELFKQEKARDAGTFADSGGSDAFDRGVPATAATTDDDDRELLSAMSPGTVFRFTQDLSNFGYRNVVIQDGEIYADLSALQAGRVYCELPLDFSTPRTLRKGARLQVSSVSGPWGSNHGRTTLRSVWFHSDGGPVELLCQRYPDRGPEITKREFVRTVRGVLRYEAKSKVRNGAHRTGKYGKRATRGLIPGLDLLLSLKGSEWGQEQ